MHFTYSRMLPVLLGYLLAQVKAYPMQQWPLYAQQQSEYPHEEYYFGPQYYYDAPAPAVMYSPEMYERAPYPNYYDKSPLMSGELPKGHEERLSALPIGQETWFESDSLPYRGSEVDDVNAAFLDNLILTQMAQDAQRRRENTRIALQQASRDYDYDNSEDEEVRELKALTTKPKPYPAHYPKESHNFEDIEDYPADDAFINWNGHKRSVVAKPAATTTAAPKTVSGQKEEVMPRPAQNTQRKRSGDFYNTIKRLINRNANNKVPTKTRRIDKRFVAGDRDLVQELRGLKHRIAT